MALKQPAPIGQRYGRLTVIGDGGSRRLSGKKPVTFWLCRCDCGAVTEVRANNLKGGVTRSCGCLSREVRAKLQRKHGMASRKGRAPEYNCWDAMIRRCHTLTDSRFHDYGARGISVCDRWRESFENFYADMGPRPSPKHSLDRIKNDGNYEPGNCRWATRDVQMRNMRSNIHLTFNGKTQTITDWTRELGFPREMIRRRIADGWPTDAALSTPSDIVTSRRKAAELRAAGLLRSGAKEGDGHWSTCPFGSGDADTDPDRDCSEQVAELM